MNDAHAQMIPIACSIGANLGNRMEALNYALSRLSSLVEELQCSSVYETEPVGYTKQPAFLNCACIGVTKASVSELMQLINEIHVELNRKPRPKWHEREIDIDILFYGDSIYREYDIEIPHPRMHERAFVLIPMAEIAPTFIHPTLRKTIEELYAQCPDTASVERLDVDL